MFGMESDRVNRNRHHKGPEGVAVGWLLTGRLGWPMAGSGVGSRLRPCVLDGVFASCPSVELVGGLVSRRVGSLVGGWAGRSVNISSYTASSLHFSLLFSGGLFCGGGSFSAAARCSVIPPLASKSGYRCGLSGCRA